MKNGPDLWDEILAYVRPIYSDRAIIAGGCVRDYILGVEPKDIDVWLNLNYSAPLTLQFRQADTLRRFGSAGELTGALFGRTINVISMPSPSSDTLVWKFDLGINRSWYDGEIHDTDEALKDRTDQTLTILRRDDAEATGNRIRAIQSTDWGRGYKVINPTTLNGGVVTISMRDIMQPQLAGMQEVVMRSNESLRRFTGLMHDTSEVLGWRPLRGTLSESYNG